MKHVYILELQIPYESTHLISINKSFEGCVGAAIGYMSCGLGLDHWDKISDYQDSVTWECHGDYLHIDCVIVDG